jgi:hypothetical protein
MHSNLYGLHGINKPATSISMTSVSGGIIKPLLQVELDCIAVDKNVNGAGLVQLGNSVFLESSNHNLFSLCKMLSSR